ncbi:Gfo/Idh/MocA family protein [Oligosphaera ethanolica]|uniref:Dehydrogenase n=1 Tax=Oligosphaera ethanolica TaxID=760260 RepID=A0AAE4ARA8_9BACT|nr:Gfo/Idh/MocA family oxidoreductase [Oligosphaera ethanolica]MDQ0291297.1 putative dehydrogenase [Oligosphaera ethanolica]
MKKIKIGQIGIGHNHASEKMAAFRRLSDFYEVVGVVESDPEWKERRGNLPQYQGLPWLTEEELFQTPGLEAVAVETDGFDLLSTAQRCVDHGMHIHMDKPGGEELEPFRRLLDCFRQKHLCIQLGYMYRNNPAVNFCFKAARSGWLGDIFEVHAVMSRYDGDDYRRWLSGFKGGAMYIFGGHLIDLVISLLGRPQKVTPYQRKTRDDNLYDNGFAVMEYPRATASIRTSVVEIDGMKHRRLIVCGTKGTVDICPLEHHSSRYHLDPLHVRLTLKEDNAEFKAGTHDVVMPVMQGRYDLQLTELARIIRGEITNPYPVLHELLVQEALLQAAGYYQ